MTRQRNIFLIAGLILMGLGAGFLGWLHSSQRLGQPAVKTEPTADPKRLAVILPEKVLDYTSSPGEITKIELDMLPKDTSFGRRMYSAPDGFNAQLAVVLMGADRTSLHKPEFCLTGQGVQIDWSKCAPDTLHVEGSTRYDIPIMKLAGRREGVGPEGKLESRSVVYVYWFVADGASTASHSERMWWMAKHILTTGVLQRWAYISCYAECVAGNEQATYERMKQLLAAAAPEFQSPPNQGPKALARQ